MFTCSVFTCVPFNFLPSNYIRRYFLKFNLFSNLVESDRDTYLIPEVARSTDSTFRVRGHDFAQGIATNTKMTLHQKSLW